MVRAARTVFLTQSALSLQIKRLEELLQVTLLDREGRRLTLTQEGTVLLPFARQILAQNDGAVRVLDAAAISGPFRIGVVQDFAEGLLSTTLAGFASQNPGAQVQIKVGGSEELRGLFQQGALDLALFLSVKEDVDTVMHVPMQWLGAPELAERSVLPIGLLEEPCLFRAASLTALEAAGRSYTVVLETQSLSALAAAVEGRMIVSCRTALSLGRSQGPCRSPHLPTLPEVNLVLKTDASARVPVRRLRQLVLDAVTEDLSSAGLSKAHPVAV